MDKLTASRNLAKNAIQNLGKPAMDFFISHMFDDKRVLDLMANGAWTAGRKKVQQFPPDVQRYLSKFNGMERIVQSVLLMAPAYVDEMEEDKLKDGLKVLEPYARAIIQLVEGDSNAD